MTLDNNAKCCPYSTQKLRKTKTNTIINTDIKSYKLKNMQTNSDTAMLSKTDIYKGNRKFLTENFRYNFNVCAGTCQELNSSRIITY
jgi:hypothetical protein